MDLPRRKSLPHQVPLWIDPLKEVYFLTCNCQPKGTNHLAKTGIAGPLLDSVRLRNEQFIWFAHLFLIMPDHVHALISFPPSEHGLRETVTLWKHGRPDNSASNGNGISSSIGCVRKKAGGKRRITFWPTRCEKILSANQRVGRMYLYRDRGSGQLGEMSLLKQNQVGTVRRAVRFVLAETRGPARPGKRSPRRGDPTRKIR